MKNIYYKLIFIITKKIFIVNSSSIYIRTCLKVCLPHLENRKKQWHSRKLIKISLMQILTPSVLRLCFFIVAPLRKINWRKETANKWSLSLYIMERISVESGEKAALKNKLLLGNISPCSCLISFLPSVTTF